MIQAVAFALVLLASLSSSAQLFPSFGPGRAGLVAVGNSCTDGVDCPCDLRPEGVGNSVMCEDYESQHLYENTSQSWAASPPGDSPYRGGNSYFTNRYGSAGAGNWTNGQPASPRIGSTCGYGTCGAREYCSEQQGNIADGNGADCWNGNTGGAAIDIQRVGDVDDEVTGLTLDLNHGGRQWLAYRVGLGSYGGIFGRKEFTTGNLTTFGIRARVAYSSNLASATVNSWDGDFTTMPWKHAEFTDPYDALLFMGNTGQTAGRPLNPAVILSSSGACSSADSGTIEHVGTVNCNNNVLRVGSNFDRSTSWPLGQWACVRSYISGMGSSTATWKIWFNDELVFHATNIDLSTMNASNADDWVFNGFYNGNDTSQPTNIPAVETFYRYEDDVEVWKNQEPETCAALGSF